MYLCANFDHFSFFSSCMIISKKKIKYKNVVGGPVTHGLLNNLEAAMQTHLQNLTFWPMLMVLMTITGPDAELPAA